MASHEHTRTNKGRRRSRRNDHRPIELQAWRSTSRPQEGLPRRQTRTSAGGRSIRRVRGAARPRARIRAGPRVVDLGAGTGKLTRQLVATDADVVAVEPIPEMRRKLEAALPKVEALDGTAEDLPLENHSVDAVLVAQAFHWFDGSGRSEIRRVLRPVAARADLAGARRIGAVGREAQRDHRRRRRRASALPRPAPGAQAFELTALFEPLHETRFESVQRAQPERSSTASHRSATSRP